jgi:bifunctional enzyme CysN/CysC
MGGKIVKILICGSVDDGKSTFLGKFLYDNKFIHKDLIEEIRNQSHKYGTQGKKIDLALLTDGLQSEREQGITIDVAYRYFYLKKKKYILADTPGHFEYTKNMVTGASNSDYAVILIDATKGISKHTKLCALVNSILRLKKIIVVVNKMDLVNYKKAVYEKIKLDFLDYLNKINYFEVIFIPISALVGDNILIKSKKMKWYCGQTFFEIIKNIEISKDIIKKDFIMGLQLVSRSSSERIYCGTIFSGTIKKNDKILIIPSNQLNKVKKIFSNNGISNIAQTGDFVSLVLDKNTDASRGSFFCSNKDQIKTFNFIQANIIWIDKNPLEIGKKYKIKFVINSCEAQINYISYKFEKNTLKKIKSDKLSLNEIGFCKITLSEKIPLEVFTINKRLGSFILIDYLTNNTVAAGTIEDLQKADKQIFWQDQNSKAISEKREYPSHKPFVLWFTGLPASGKTTVANFIQSKLSAYNLKTYCLDGDNLRHGLCKDLRFTEIDRKENIRRAAEVAKLMMNMGLIVIASFITPLIAHRSIARKIIGKENFIEIFTDAPVILCEQRDKKGLYKKARLGNIKNFTGVSYPYEKPLNPDLKLNSKKFMPNQLANIAINFLKKNKFI